jgi:hypothetical protein
MIFHALIENPHEVTIVALPEDCTATGARKKGNRILAQGNRI